MFERWILIYNGGNLEVRSTKALLFISGGMALKAELREGPSKVTKSQGIPNVTIRANTVYLKNNAIIVFLEPKTVVHPVTDETTKKFIQLYRQYIDVTFKNPREGGFDFAIIGAKQWGYDYVPLIKNLTRNFPSNVADNIEQIRKEATNIFLEKLKKV